MNSFIKLNKIEIAVCVLLYLLPPLNFCQLLADNNSEDIVNDIPYAEMPRVFGLIASDIRDNYEKIITWSGQINVKINRLHSGESVEGVFVFTDRRGEMPESILQKIEEKITFSVDVKKGFIYVDNSREKPSQYYNSKTGDDIGNKGSSPYRSTLIAKPDYVIESRARRYSTDDNKVIGMKAVKKTSTQDTTTNLYRGIDDPRKVFMPGGNPWEGFEWLTQYIDTYGKAEIGGYSLRVTESKNNDSLEYKIVKPSAFSASRKDPNDYIIQTKIYSDKFGFNITYWYITYGSGKPIQEFTYEYELIDGIYLPKKVREKYYSQNGEVYLEKDCNYTNNKVNKEISPGTFESTNLNLKDGDILVDEISKEEYQYEEPTKTFKLLEKQK